MIRPCEWCGYDGREKHSVMDCRLRLRDLQKLQTEVAAVAADWDALRRSLEDIEQRLRLLETTQREAQSVRERKLAAMDYENKVAAIVSSLLDGGA